MPNTKAKDRKRKRRQLNKKWLAKEKSKGPQLPVYGRR